MNEQNALPSNLEAERFVLGAGIVDNEIQGAIMSDMSADDFSLDAHKVIFEAMRVCYSDLGEFDRVIITNYLQSRGELSRAGGMTTLMDLDAGMPQSLNWQGYAQIVKEKAMLRRAIFASQSLIDQLWNELRPSEDLLQAAARIQDVLGAVKSETKTAGEIIEEKGIDGLFGTPSSAEGVVLPWPALAEVVPLLRPGNLIVLAAGTGYGKSSFARQIALDVTLRQFKGAFIASYEMTSDEVLVAMACTHAEVNGWKIDTGHCSEFEKRKLTEGVGELKAAPLYLFDGSPTLTALESEMRKCIAKQTTRGQSLGVAVVDYLQLMDPGKRVSGETERVATVARGLKNIASRLKIPIIALSQFSRPERGKVYTGDEMMGMLKNSSEIEQAANVILILEPVKIDFDPTVGPPKTIPYHVHVTKQRKGPKGMKSMVFDRWITRFREETKEGFDI